MDTNKSSQICRACLETSEKMYPLLGSIVNVDVNIAFMISYCTSEELQLDENLPDSVCVPCFKIIRISYNFLRQFKESQERLKKLNDDDCIKLDLTRSGKEETSNTIISAETSYVTSSLEMLKRKDDTNFEAIRSVNENTLGENSGNLTDSSDEPIFSNLHSEVNTTESNKVSAQFVSKRDSACANIFVCPICRAEFVHLQKFSTHVLLHNVNIIVCDKCSVPITLSTPNYLKHYKEHHRYQCKLCGKSLTSSYGFRYHMKHHENIRKYVCPIKHCTRSYFLYHLLKKHMSSHSKTTNYKCDLCGIAFKTYDTLKYHQKTHGGKRNHLCTQCGKAFFQAVHLRDHMFIHMDYKQFTCDGCGHSFTTSSQLKAHIKHCL